MVERNCQIVVVDTPELLEQHFRLGARIDKNERRPVLLDGLIDVGQRITRGMPRPGQAFI